MEKLGKVTYENVSYDIYDNTNAKMRFLISYDAKKEGYLIPKDVFEYLHFEKYFEPFTNFVNSIRKQMKRIQIVMFGLLAVGIFGLTFISVPPIVSGIVAFAVLIVYSFNMSNMAIKYANSFIALLTPEELKNLFENAGKVKESLNRVKNSALSVNHEKQLVDTMIYVISKNKELVNK